MWLTQLRTFKNFLGKNKLYTFVTILGFSISLMFVLLLFTFTKKELSVDNFHENKDRIFLLASSPSKAYFANPVAPFLKQNLPEIESYTRILPLEVWTGTKTDPVKMDALLADKDFFHIFSFELLEGDKSSVLATKNSAVITRTFAQKMFPGENPVGKLLQFENDQNSVTITGVMEDFIRNTQIPEGDIVVNYEMLNALSPDETNKWYSSGFTMYFLAKENADLPSKASTVVDLFYKQDYKDYTMEGKDEVIFVPLQDVYFSGMDTASGRIRMNNKKVIYIYITITLLILIVAVLNYISLSVSQTGKRGKEAATKKLMGCSKNRLLAQFVSESVLITGISFVLSIILAFVFEPYFNDLFNTTLYLRHELLHVPYAAAILVSILLIGCVSGIMPAMLISGFEPIEIVKGTYIRKMKTSYSKLLITFQYVVAISLLICTAFIFLQTRYMRNYDMGFTTDNILIMTNKVQANQESSLRSLLADIPRVEKISFTDGVPLTRGMNRTFEHNGQVMSIQEFNVDSAFFDLFGIQILSTTGVQVTDMSIWINQSGYDAFDIDPQSYTFVFWDNQVTKQIAGITNDFNVESLHAERGITWIKFRDGLSPSNFIAVKIGKGADLFETTEEIKKAYSGFTGGQQFDAWFSDEILQKWYEGEEKTSRLLSIFTVLTFIILLMGILAMSLYYVQQKHKEIGMRKINGATEKQIIGMLNLNFLKPVLIAFVISVPISYYVVDRWLENFAYRISLHWWVFLLTAILVVIITIAFVSYQSRRAAVANPVDSLKGE